MGQRLSRMMAIALVLAPLVAQSEQPAAADFSGTWQRAVCDKNDPGRECGGFMLVLVQQGDAVCGTHWAATAGLARLDEGEPPSLRGRISGGKAFVTGTAKALVTIRSGRTGTVGKAELVLSGNSLTWRLVDDPEGDYYLPEEATLTRSASADDPPFAVEARLKCASPAGKAL